MKYVAEDDNCIYSMCGENQSILSVPDGSEVLFKTKDCFGNQIKSKDTPFDSLDWDNINPATGPVDIDGAEVGDVLKVEILEINIKNQASMITGKDLGLLGDKLSKNYVRIIPIKNDVVEFSEKVKIKTRPMIGVIGVAPKDAKVNCGTPGEHGGNMDCKEITAGSTLFLPVFVKGAKLAMGDLHAVMGDGEVSVCGAEVPGEVLVKVTVLKNSKIPTPLIQKPGYIMPIASEKTLDDAASAAVLKAVKYLVDVLGFEDEEAISFLSLASDVKICQMVDPLKTVRVEIPVNLISK